MKKRLWFALFFVLAAGGIGSGLVAHSKVAGAETVVGDGTPTPPPYIGENLYYALPGKADAVYELRVKATALLRSLGHRYEPRFTGAPAAPVQM